MKKRIVQIIQAGLLIVMLILICIIIYLIGDWLFAYTVTYRYVLWAFTLELITSLILLLSFGYERYLSQRMMKIVMKLQLKLESYGDIADLTEIQLNSYISTLETAVIMNSAGEISLKEFYSHFGYSLERLLQDTRVNVLMQKHMYLNDIVYRLQKKLT